MITPQGCTTKRTSCCFSRTLISVNGRSDATILRLCTHRLRADTADFKGRHEMDMHVKGQPSRPSPARSGDAALLYGQWGGRANNGEDDDDNGSQHDAGLRRMICCQCGAVLIACTSLDVVPALMRRSARLRTTCQLILHQPWPWPASTALNNGNYQNPLDSE